MKQILSFLIGIIIFCSCHKKNETPDFSALLTGKKWICSSYKKDDSDKIISGNIYSLSGHYEKGWEFMPNKKIRFNNGGGWNETVSEDANYSVVENKSITINLFTTNGDTSVFKFEIIELSENKLTVHTDFWKSTFFLLRE